MKWPPTWLGDSAPLIRLNRIPRVLHGNGIFTYRPSKGVKFQLLGLFVVVKGLKFHTLGGFSTYIYHEYMANVPENWSVRPIFRGELAISLREDTSFNTHLQRLWWFLLSEHLPTERKGEVWAACKCQFTNCLPYINQATGNRLLLVVESDGIIYVW